MVIQCREEMFNTICDTLKKEPYIVEQSGGYIDCFDKGWVFISVDYDANLIDTITATHNETQFLIGITEIATLIQHNICENEKYIFMRKSDTNICDILWGASSYIKFKGN